MLFSTGVSPRIFTDTCVKILNNPKQTSHKLSFGS